MNIAVEIVRFTRESTGLSEEMLIRLEVYFEIAREEQDYVPDSLAALRSTEGVGRGRGSGLIRKVC